MEVNLFDKTTLCVDFRPSSSISLNWSSFNVATNFPPEFLHAAPPTSRRSDAL